jgi:hypothetical protein
MLSNKNALEPVLILENAETGVSKSARISL